MSLVLEGLVFTESSMVRNVGIGLASTGVVAIIGGIALSVVWDREITSTNGTANYSTLVFVSVRFPSAYL